MEKPTNSEVARYVKDAEQSFIDSYVAAYLAGMYVKRSDEHMYTGKHPYTKPKDVPIEDAWFMANVAWKAHLAQYKAGGTSPVFDEEDD